MDWLSKIGKKNKQKESVKSENITFEKVKGERDESKGKSGAIVVESKEYYKTAYFKAIGVAFWALVIGTMSFGGNFYQYTHRPKPVYFASTSDLRLAKMIPLSRPVISQAALITWSTETVQKTFSLDFRSVKEQLTEVRVRYTRKAFKDLMNTLENSGNLLMLKENRLSATVIPTEAPVITKEGILKNKLTWIIEFPIMISYQDMNGIKNQQKLHVKMIVERVSTAVEPKGILVKQIMTRPA